MWRLLARHFDGVSPRRFEADLAAKSAAILLLDSRDSIVGFSTLLVREAMVRAEPVTLVYSGDTVVEAPARQHALLARAWIAGVRQLTAGVARRILWLLICSGFRTYRFLPVFWREYWPRWDRETPLRVAQELDELAHEMFGGSWDRESGVVRPVEPQMLREESATIAEGRLHDPDVAFFLLRNPGWRGGDELVCLAEISAANLTRAGRRAWGA